MYMLQRLTLNHHVPQTSDDNITCKLFVAFIFYILHLVQCDIGLLAACPTSRVSMKSPLKMSLLISYLATGQPLEGYSFHKYGIVDNQSGIFWEGSRTFIASVIS